MGHRPERSQGQPDPLSDDGEKPQLFISIDITCNNIIFFGNGTIGADCVVSADSVLKPLNPHTVHVGDVPVYRDFLKCPDGCRATWRAASTMTDPRTYTAWAAAAVFARFGYDWIAGGELAVEAYSYIQSLGIGVNEIIEYITDNLGPWLGGRWPR